MSNLKFEWDEAKNLANQQKHDVSFEEASVAFDDPNHIIVDDLAHSLGEPRFFCIGLGSNKERVLTVRFTKRGDRIRIFGAAYWRKERKVYEKSQFLRGQ